MNRQLIAGNWKMNGLKAGLAELGVLRSGPAGGHCDVAICPPATLLEAAARAVDGSTIRIGGQDCHADASGAHTGDISAEMIADAGGTLVLVGHSERRVDHKESDAAVKAKALAARRAGLTAVVCIGETGDERKAGKALEILDRQLAGSIPDGGTAEMLVVAYEPVWAIGTGLTASSGDILEAHAHIRARLAARFAGEGAKMRILYGGSVKPSNAAEILALANVDGALVGGASLKAQDFLAIIAGARKV